MGLSDSNGEIPIKPVVPHQFSQQHYVYLWKPSHTPTTTTTTTIWGRFMALRESHVINCHC